MRIVFRLIIVGCIAASFAAAASGIPTEQREIMELYRRGLAGDAKAVEDCIAKLEAVLQKESSNQLARVYLGSAYTLRSRDLGFGPKKLQALKQGLATMDEAVAAAPNEHKVRLARALTTSALPSIFGRNASAREDFLFLANAAQRNPDTFDADDLALVYYHCGLAAKQAGDKEKALAFWSEALRHRGDAKLVEKINAELAKLR